MGSPAEVRGDGPPGRTTVFHKQPRLLLFFLILGLAFTIQGIATAGFFLLGEDAYDIMRPVGFSLGVFLAGIGVWFAFSARRRLRGPREAIMIGPAGLHDHAISEHPIAWRDIRNIRVRSTARGGRFVAFDLTEGTAERAGLHPWPRFAMATNRLFGYDLYVFRMGTDASVDRLVEAVSSCTDVQS